MWTCRKDKKQKHNDFSSNPTDQRKNNMINSFQLLSTPQTINYNLQQFATAI